jgi:hypothetical protein
MTIRCIKEQSYVYLSGVTFLVEKDFILNKRYKVEDHISFLYVIDDKGERHKYRYDTKEFDVNEILRNKKLKRIL